MMLTDCKITEKPDQPTKKPPSQTERVLISNLPRELIPFEISSSPLKNTSVYSFKPRCRIMLLTDVEMQEKKQTKAQMLSIGKTDDVIA